MRKKLSLFLASAMMLGCISGCGDTGKDVDVNTEAAKESSAENSQVEIEEKSEAENLKIVTTIFPEYDWVKNILGDNADAAEITLLLDNGVDLHSYQPTAEDMVKIKECDMFVYVGGESDEWVEDVLDNTANPDMKVINLLEVLGDTIKEEEIVEGMEHDHDHDHSKEVSTFEDDEVKDRTLADWAGEWQSPYPYVLDGTLDEAFEAMAESKGDKDAEGYKEYYKTGYKTDIASVKIAGDNIEYTYDDGTKVNSDYKYAGYFIQDWSSGTRAAMYRFEAVDKEAGVPLYIEINDHMIEPAEAEHFHIRMNNESFDSFVDVETSWPTFFPADMTGEEICDHLAGHDHDDEEEDEHEHEDAEHDDEEHEDVEHDEEEHHHEEGEVEYDEHVWLSLRNAEVICDKLSTELGTLDPANADLYKSNAEAYKEELAALDKEYEAAVAAGSKDTLLFGDRFPFRYLVDDYGLNYYAAFVGCSAESEASFETIVFLAGKVDELNLGAVMTIEGPNHDIAESVKNATTSKDQVILTMDSMQSTTSKDIEAGTTYLSVMTDNLEVLKEALK